MSDVCTKENIHVFHCIIDQFNRSEQFKQQVSSVHKFGYFKVRIQRAQNMLEELKNCLLLGGILNDQKYRRKSFFIVISVVLIQGFFILAAIIYSFERLDVFDFIKEAGFTYINVMMTLANYLYMILNRDKLEHSINSWDMVIRNSYVSVRVTGFLPKKNYSRQISILHF